ncbi:MAG: hypothetical protein ACR2I8_06290 [Steroidobacteraceae bacterium]
MAAHPGDRAARPRFGWLAYASLLTVAVVGGELARGRAPDAVAVASWTLSAALLTALWCHALRRRLGNESYWRAVFWLVAGANLLMLLPVLLSGGIVALVTGGLTLLIVPAYVAAWRYAYRSPDVWQEPTSR